LFEYIINKFNILPNKIRERIYDFFNKTTLLKNTNFFYTKKLNNFFSKASMKNYDRYSEWHRCFNKDMKDLLYQDNLKNYNENTNHMLKLFSSLKNVDNLDQSLIVDLLWYLPNDLLTKIDICSMSHSLEVRCPFLDNNLTEFMLTLPNSFLIKKFKTKYILKKTYNNKIPNEIINRKKHGFIVPVGDWLKDDLKDFFYQNILEGGLSNRNIFNTKYINNIYKQHINNKNDYSLQLWSLLVLEIWFKEFIDK